MPIDHYDLKKYGTEYTFQSEKVKDKIKESDDCKLAASSIESWLLKLMTETCMGKNDEGWKEWGLDNFVLTPKGDEGIKQSGIKDKVLSFLK